MTRREVMGAALLFTAAVAGSTGSWLAEEAQKALSQDVFLFVSVPVAAIGAWLVVLALLAGAAGVILLIPALIRRIGRRKLRLATSWIMGLAAASAAPYVALLLFFASLGAAMSSDFVRFEAAGGQSVLVTQDQFDGDTVNIYTREDVISYH